MFIPNDEIKLFTLKESPRFTYELMTMIKVKRPSFTPTQMIGVFLLICLIFDDINSNMQCLTMCCKVDIR